MTLPGSGIIQMPQLLLLKAVAGISDVRFIDSDIVYIEVSLRGLRGIDVSRGYPIL